MSKRKITIILILVITLVIASLYQTFASDVTTNNATPIDADQAFNFNLNSNTNKQVIVSAGDTKIFDIKISNTNSTTIKYGIAYQMISPDTLPSGVTIAKAETSSHFATSVIRGNSTKIVTIVVQNESLSSITVNISIITGYEFGGDLIVPNYKTLISTDEPLTTLADHIIELATTNTTQIRTVTHEAITSNTATGNTIPAVTDYRYYSADENADGIPDPINNYIYYNCTDPSDTDTCEKWRIIGVFYDELTDSNRVKIINESIGDMAWDTENLRAEWRVNAWTATTGTPAVTSDATINTYLNGTYYNRLSASAKALTEDASWYLGGHDTYASTSSTFYNAERENVTYSTTHPGNDAYTRATYWEGKIGLMYTSDYGYAASSSCVNNTNLGYGGYNISCKSTDWLYNSSYWQWTMSPRSGTSYDVFYVGFSGSVNNNYVDRSRNAVRPVLYLISEAEFVDGNGSIEYPFVIN